MVDEIIKKNLDNTEYLMDIACKNSEAIRLNNDITDYRPPYFRDVDRIIYSLSYTRYIDKTQVFSFVKNDHVSKRIIHVNLVSKIARTIGRALKLNEDLIEAIALGHDLGHVPFGHVGERILNEISLKYNNTPFNHAVQSVRNLMVVENNGLGRNLCIQTLDGILSHNGEIVDCIYSPIKKTKEEFLNDYHSLYDPNNSVKNIRPMTLEGCVVRISDLIGYLGRDIEDAVRLNVLSIDDIPQSISKVLGTSNRQIVNTIVTDIINNSYSKPYIKLSEKIYQAISDLKDFNYKNIYYKANTKEQIEEYKYMFNYMFESYLKMFDDKNSLLYTKFINKMEPNYLKNTNKYTIIIDYIAGMTDDYFIKSYKSLKNS